MIAESYLPISIPIYRLDQLQSDSKNLKRAWTLIARLRAENALLRQERRAMLGVVEGCRRSIHIAGNPQKKFAVAYVISKLKKARFI